MEPENKQKTSFLKLVFLNSTLELIISIVSLFFIIVSESNSRIIFSIIFITSFIGLLSKSYLKDAKIEKETSNNTTDLISSLWSKTEQLMLSFLRIIHLRCFIALLLIILLISILHLKYSDIYFLLKDYLFALASSLFAIWIIEVTYSDKMDREHETRINLVLQQIFQRRKWLGQMSDEWKEKAVHECYKATFEDELGSFFAGKTYSSQLYRNGYRKYFSYHINLKRAEETYDGIQSSPAFLCQKLSYMKKYTNKNFSTIISLFEFKEDPFFKEEEKELIFFREELRSLPLILLLQKAEEIAINITENIENNNFVEAFKKITIRDYFTNINDEIKDEIEKIWNLFINNISYQINLEYIDESTCVNIKDIVFTIMCAELLNYRLTCFDANGKRGFSNNETIKASYINNSIKSGIKFTSYITDKCKDLWSKTVSEIDNSNKYSFVFYEIECGYCIYKQESFYWKFSEPILAPNFWMIFPQKTQMKDVHVVQYFSDSKHTVNKCDGMDSVSFFSTELFLPESGVYIHWPEHILYNKSI